MGDQIAGRNTNARRKLQSDLRQRLDDHIRCEFCFSDPTRANQNALESP